MKLKQFFFIFIIIIIGASCFAQAIRIMPLGDSITGTPGCWRAILWNKLQDAGFTNIDFVGTLTGQSCSLPFDNDSEGHGGIKATDIADQNQLVPWLNATNPDIVMMHLGTNDILSRTKSTEEILSSYSTMVKQMRANNPKMIILVAQILPLYTATNQCTACYQQVIELNNAIPAWAKGLNNSQSPVVVVDQWTGFDTKLDTGDGIHPTDSGNKKIADNWYAILVPFLSTTPIITQTPEGPILGDVNKSDTVDIVDALLIAQFYVGLNPADFTSNTADVNCSNSVDIVDALLVAQFYVGLILKFC